jgi:hypothetical protein
MKSKFRPHLILSALLALSGLNSTPSTAQAQGTAFTYQGQLNTGGAPAAGSYDFIFALFNNSQDGSQLGPSLTNSAVGVTNGLFLTTLDFGGGLFTGSSCWLDIGVRTNGAGAFTELAPRQPVTPAPYSIFAGTASTLSAHAVLYGARNGSTGLLLADISVTNGLAAQSSVAAAAANAAAQVAALGQTSTNTFVPVLTPYWPHTLYVSINGSDANLGTNANSPFLTLTNALQVAANLLGGSNLILLGQGYFPFPTNTVVSANTAIAGQGEGVTTLVPTGLGRLYRQQNIPCLVTEGDNIQLRNFTLGTNTADPWFYYLLSPEWGTNFTMENVRIYGSSDNIFLDGCNLQSPLPFLGAFVNCSFYSAYDVVFTGGLAVGSQMLFRNCDFNITNFPVPADDPVASPHGIHDYTATVYVENCVFNISNDVNQATCGIEIENAVFPAVATVKNCAFNVQNGPYPAQQYGVLLNGSGTTLNVIGAINPANIGNAGGTVNFDAAQFGAVAASSFSGSGSGLTNLAVGPQTNLVVAGESNSAGLSVTGWITNGLRVTTGMSNGWAWFEGPYDSPYYGEWRTNFTVADGAAHWLFSNSVAGTTNRQRLSINGPIDANCQTNYTVYCERVLQAFIWDYDGSSLRFAEELSLGNTNGCGAYPTNGNGFVGVLCQGNKTTNLSWSCDLIYRQIPSQ